jgi:hypothetical protein
VKETHVNSNADAPLLCLRAHIGRLKIDFSGVNRLSKSTPVPYIKK